MAITGSTDFGGCVLLVTVDHDPTSVATDVCMGSLIIRKETSTLYKKLDDGSTTNVGEIGVTKPTETISGVTTTIEDSDGKYTILVDASSNDCLFNLPTASANANRVLEFKIIDTDAETYTVTVRPEEGENLDQYTYAAPWSSSTKWGSLRVKSNGTGWYIMP